MLFGFIVAVGFSVLMCEGLSLLKAYFHIKERWYIVFSTQKESEKRNVTVQPDDPISFMQLTAKNEMNCKEDQFQLSLLAAMGNTQRKEAADPLASKLNKVTKCQIHWRVI